MNGTASFCKNDRSVDTTSVFLVAFTAGVFGVGESLAVIRVTFVVSVDFAAGFFAFVANLVLPKIKSLLVGRLSSTTIDRYPTFVKHATMVLLMIIAVIYFVVLTILFIFMACGLTRSLRRFRITKSYTAARNAPSVSICIPARNEMHAMTQCLERVLASDYPKLEVIVYDDSSGDDTSVLIRSFAHAGVRFVPGTTLPDGWVGKNHALQVLANEASGRYVLFMDVDTIIQPTTVSQLVGYMDDEKVDMVSVIPGRTGAWRTSVLFGHLRYFWQLLFSRPAAPASSSSLWMIERTALLKTLGGFEPYKAAIAPEADMAAKLGTSAYHCLIGTVALGVTYEKKWLSQVETSRRLLYPLAGGRVWLGLLGLLFLALLGAPVAIVGYAVGTHQTLLAMVASVYLLAFMCLYGVYTRATWQHYWWLGALCWPIVVLQELVLLVSSMLGYLRHTITWKGRLLTAPVLRTDHIEIDQ